MRHFEQPLGRALSRLVAVAAVSFSAELGVPAPLAAQARTGTSTAHEDPLRVAEQFYRAIGQLRWDVLAQLTHPDALGVVRMQVGMIVDGDRSGEVLRIFLELPDRLALDALSDEEVFRRVVGGIHEHVPGLIQVLATNRFEVVGSVPDGGDRAQVVVRMTPFASGDPASRMRVLTLARTDRGWRALESEELEALRTALLGLPIGR